MVRHFIGLLFFLASAATLTFAAETGDVNADLKIDLVDTILSLQVSAGMSPANIDLNADSNGDQKIGAAEAIYTLLRTAGAPVIMAHPQSQAVTTGQTATFAVTATGTETLHYQWKKGSTNIGTDNASFAIASVQTDDAGSYTVTVTNSVGTETSKAATLTVSQNTGYLPGDVMAPWEGGPAYYAKWTHGPSSNPSIFPLAVWLQSVDKINSYKNIGVNYFVGLWNGPTESQLSGHISAQMPVFTDQNTVGLTSSNNGIIKSWLQIDEPDNAQNNTQDPIPTADIINRYTAMVAQDATRPVLLNLGQGVAADSWYGRGNRTNHPEDYAQYALGADILSFDIYPMNVFPRPTTDPPWFTAFNNTVAQNIWYVAGGVDRLRGWTNYQKPVWAWIETTNINGDQRYALTPIQVKAEVWMAIIHGAAGIGYFCHQWNPFIEAGLLSNATMAAAVDAINAQITALAPVLNSRSVSNGVTVVPSNTNIPVDTMVKRSGGYTYVFAVPMRPGSVNATFALRMFAGNSTVEVVGEGRTISASNGVFQDSFTNYAVHIYKVAQP